MDYPRDENGKVIAELDLCNKRLHTKVSKEILDSFRRLQFVRGEKMLLKN